MIVRVRDDAIVFDVRTITEAEFEEIATAAAEACRVQDSADPDED